MSNENMKTLKTKICINNSVIDTNFLRFLEFLKTLKLCFQSDWESFFAWIWSPCWVYLITNYVKCSLFGFVFVFNYCVTTTEDVPMGEIVKFVSASSSMANLGLFGELIVQFKYWWLNSNRIRKCKPALSTRAVFDIASALQKQAGHERST